MIKAIFLDFDETIFDHKHSAAAGLTAIGEEYEQLMEHPLEWLEEEFWKLMDWNYDQVLSKKITPDEARISRIRELFKIVGMEPPTSDLPRLGELYKTKYVEASRSIPGIKELIIRLKEKGYYLGVITNGHTESQRGRLKQLELSQYFDYLTASEEAESEKPDTKIFHYALEKANCEAHEAFMIGDAWEKDVAGALNVGMKAVWFKRRENPAADSSLAPIVETTEELESILKKEQLL